MSRPVASYGPVLGTYATVVAALTYAVRRASATVPRPKPTDVVLLGLATFKLSRLITKEKVTQPLREPFVAGTEAGDGSEVNSKPAGAGVRRALGELLTCPFCVSVWIATALTAAFAVAPRAVRLVASGLAAVVIADSSQYAYSGLRKTASRSAGRSLPSCAQLHRETRLRLRL